MANFTAAMIALVDERDRQFLERVAQDFNLPFEQLSKLYLETSVTAIKVPRKYTKKVKEATAVTTVVEPKPAKEPKAKAEKQKCTACTSKKEPCKFSALKGEVFCKRHLRTTQEAESGAPAEKAAKKAAATKKAEQPVHTHALTENAKGECELCESHGNPLAEEAEFEVVMGTSGTAPMTVAERLAAILSDEGESDAESEAYENLEGLTEEGFEEDD